MQLNDSFDAWQTSSRGTFMFIFKILLWNHRLMLLAFNAHVNGFLNIADVVFRTNAQRSQSVIQQFCFGLIIFVFNLYDENGNFVHFAELMR